MVNHFIRYQTKPNATVQAPVHCTTRRFYTWLFCVAYSPPPYIHERRPRGKKEREGLLQGHSFKILFSDYYLTQQHFKSDYCTVYHIPLYYINYWVGPPCNTVHIYFPLDTRYFFVVHCTFVTFVYTHTSSVTFVPTLKVHYCTPYILRHYCFCSLFTLLTAALIGSALTVLSSRQRLSLCLSSLDGGRQERKRKGEKEEGEGEVSPNTIPYILYNVHTT